MDKRTAYTVSVTDSALRERVAQRSKERRIETARQEFINKLMAGMDSTDGTEAERLSQCEMAASKRTFTGEYRIHG
jgi:hypothetical protein